MSLSWAEEFTTDQQRDVDGKPFPCLLRPIPGTKVNTDEFRSLVRTRGVVLLRGFVDSGMGYYKWLCQHPWISFKTSFLGGGGPRVHRLGPDIPVYSSTETPAHLSIPFHHELGYLPVDDAPDALCFYCEVPAVKDGQTPVLVSRKVTEAVPAEFVARLREKGVIYVRKIKGRASSNGQLQRPWEDIFESEDREMATKTALAHGHQKVEFDGDTMIVASVVQQPIRESGAWWNAVALLHPATHPEIKREDAPWTSLYGDGSPIADADILSIVDAMAKNDTRIDYETHDMLFVDNELCQHARASFEGPRSIFTTMLYMDRD